MSETSNGFERVESALAVVIELAEQQVVDDDPEMAGEAHRQNRMIGVARKYMERIQREDYDPSVDLADHAKATVIGHALEVVWQMANEGALDPDDADDDALAEQVRRQQLALGVVHDHVVNVFGEDGADRPR